MSSSMTYFNDGHMKVFSFAACPKKVLKEIHSGICGAHQAGPKLHLQVKRLGYYWPTMLRDAIEMARTWKQCQIHADYIHQAPELLHPTVASWPFEAWGMDIIGPISPKSDSDRQYILAVTDYFSKWAEATAYREVQAVTVVDFIRTQIIYLYGVPRYIMTDSGTLFRNIVMDRHEKFRDTTNGPLRLTIRQPTDLPTFPANCGKRSVNNRGMCPTETSQNWSLSMNNDFGATTPRKAINPA
ncbi:hypothetical protein H6P81_002914 [Aristolochia fimbriata]|uniref:Integrase catalytic domain-containing protein n=1 Tax=Aristolochia fimbriata TaxID=158543 RepID=A0AAV7FC83_ARIFI|nr:hypothetical protein H6P81_002914 [Aristolochia fimbriata]